MWNSEYYWVIWLLFISIQIVLPLLILCCWLVFKFPSSVFSRQDSPVNAELLSVS